MLKIVSDWSLCEWWNSDEATELRNKLAWVCRGSANDRRSDGTGPDCPKQEAMGNDVAKWLAKAQELKTPKVPRSLAELSQIQELLAGNAMQPISDDYNRAKKKASSARRSDRWIEGAEKVARD